MNNRKRYTVQDVEMSRFYQLPKFLFEDEFKNLNSDARILYSLLRDRHDLSLKNNWVNENGEVFLIYTRENMAHMIGCSIPTARKAFKQLESVGLVEDEFQGFNKPNLIYLNSVSVENTRTEKTFHAGQKECFTPDRKELSPNDTELNNTNLKDTDKYKVYRGSSDEQPTEKPYDYNILNRQIDKVFKDEHDDDGNGLLSKKDIKHLFARFYEIGGYRRGIEPTKLKNEQVKNIISALLCAGDDKFLLDVDDFEKIMEEYFKQDFKECDYSINHFVSGDIIMLRCYELNWLNEL